MSTFGASNFIVLQNRELMFISKGTNAP
jgi:hypothetical protein